MNDNVLRFCVGLAVLMLPSSAIGQCRYCQINIVEIPLRDGAGTVRATLRYYRGDPGKRQVSFFDADNMLINSMGETPATAVAENSLRGDPIPDFTVDDIKGDTQADIEFLSNQVNKLNAQMKRLTDRINAAAAK